MFTRFLRTNLIAAASSLLQLEIEKEITVNKNGVENVSKHERELQPASRLDIRKCNDVPPDTDECVRILSEPT